MGDPHGTTYKIFGDDSRATRSGWYERDTGTYIDANFLPNRRTDNGNNVDPHRLADPQQAAADGGHRRHRLRLRGQLPWRP